MKDIAEIAPVPFEWTRGMISERAGTLMADLFPRGRDAQPGECIGIVKRFVAYGRRSISGHAADGMIVMGYDGRPVILTGAALGTEGQYELSRLEELLSAPGSLAFGSLSTHVADFRAPEDPPRMLELILGSHVHLLRTADWKHDIALRKNAGEPLSRAVAANLRLLAEHPRSPEVLRQRMEQMYGQASVLLGLVSFDDGALPAMGQIAA